MKPLRLAALLWGSMLATTTAFADGKVFSSRAYAVVTIPDQRALIYHAEGTETLVIETSFVGAGTNFAWLIPLPAQPQIEPAARDLFSRLQWLLRPRLVDQVGFYYLAFILFGVWVYLAREGLRDERPWLADLPVCLAAASLVGWVARDVVSGAIVLVFLALIRWAPTKELLATASILFLAYGWLGVFLTGSVTLGSETRADLPEPVGIVVLERRTVGIYDIATLTANQSKSIVDWLNQNGFNTPPTVETAMDAYVKAGWVFVAARLRRDTADHAASILHPLALTFPSEKPVYPLRLTGIDNGECLIDLYVFGSQRAAAKGWRVESCRRTDFASEPSADKSKDRPLPIDQISAGSRPLRAAVITKLTARLRPADMKSDAYLTWKPYAAQRLTLYSARGAALIALNVGTAIAATGWVGILLAAGGWGVTARGMRRWFLGTALVAAIVAVLVFWLLPKAEVRLARPLAQAMGTTVTDDRAQQSSSY